METIAKIKNRIEQFQNNYKVSHIILDDKILHNLDIPRNGYWLEFGVFSGSTINKLSKLCDKIYGFDSFEGLPENWIDGHPMGFLKLDQLPKVKDNVELVVGFFEDSIPKFLDVHNIDKISFINIDCDLYSSTKTIFKYLGQFIKSGTYLYFDEFIISKTEKDESTAFAEFLDEYNVDYEIICVCGDSDHIQILVKII